MGHNLVRAGVCASLLALTCLTGARAGDFAADPGVPEASLVAATRSSTLPPSQTVEAFNAAPVALDNAAMIGDASIAAALAENDLFGLADDGPPMPPPTIFSDLAAAEAVGRAVSGQTSGPLVVDNDGAGSGVWQLMRPADTLQDAARSGVASVPQVPENAPDTGTVDVARTGGITGARIAR
ncbi:hypothetical protein [Emcibacter sp. SYSU 3D8]|uniref:hypothetical protein n=1 Tax=Emcibacter sp. SYSU 3D8 TaxID=3133969 RepID=UPI0031FECE39